MSKIKLLIALSLFLVSCNLYRTNINVQPVSDAVDIEHFGVFYALPKTKIIVNVEVQAIVKSKGPYEQYSKQYLGDLTNVIHENKTVWYIKSIDFKTVPIIDTSRIYYVKSNSYLPLTISKEGFLLGYNCDVTEWKYDGYGGLSSKTNKPYESIRLFHYVPSDKAFKVVYDTVYKEVIYDTTIKRVPVLKPNIVKKSVQEQAKELADKLITLRDDRAALLVGEGDSEYLPDGTALEVMLREIDILTQSYLQLFTGKIDTLTYRYTFSYEPQEKDFDKKIVLFKFSKKKGLLSASTVDGEQVILHITAQEINTELRKITTFQKNFALLSLEKQNSGLYYAIPQRVIVKVEKQGEVLAETPMLIPQMGEVAVLPAKMFENKNLAIEFYPALGSIKRIFYQKKQ